MSEELIRRSDAIEALVMLSGRDNREQLERDLKRIEESTGKSNECLATIVECIQALDEVDTIVWRTRK